MENFRGSFYLTEIKQVHSIVDNLVYNLFIFRMIGTETEWLCGTINKINKIIIKSNNHFDQESSNECELATSWKV